MTKLLCTNLFVFLLCSFLQGSGLSIQEMKIEQDIENRLNQSLFFLIGKEKIFVEVDISIGAVERTVNQQSSEVEQEKKPVTNLPGFSTPKSEKISLNQFEDLIGITELNVKMILDKQVSKKLENLAKSAIQTHPVFTSVLNAKIQVERTNLKKSNPETSADFMETLFEKYEQSLAQQELRDSLRSTVNEQKLSLLSSRSVILYGTAGVFALILLLGILLLLRGLKKVSDKSSKVPEISVSIPPAPAPAPSAQSTQSTQQVNVLIDQPIELLPPSEEKKEGIAKSYNPFQFLNNLSNEMISKAVDQLDFEDLEVLIPNIPKEKAVDILHGLDDDKLKKISENLSDKKSWSRTNIDKVRDKLIQHYNSIINPEEIKAEGVSDYAEILNSNPKYNELPNRVLSLIGENNSSLRQEIFPFEDLLNIDDKILKDVLMNLNREDITIALWEKEEAISEKLLNCLNPETSKNILKRMKLLENLNPNTVFESERRIVNAVKLHIKDTSIKEDLKEDS